ncbi:MAG: ATP-binding protein [Myxococcota bacterium]
MNFEIDGQFQRLLFDTSPLGIAIVGSDGLLEGSNPAFREIVGREDAAPATLSVLELSHLGDRKELEAVLKGLTSGICDSARIAEHRFLRPDGEIRWGRVSARVSEDYTGILFLTVEDITEQQSAEEALRNHRDELQQEVEHRTKELQDSNRELEAFCYSVSHDLRAPLRALDGFAEAIIDDYHDKLDDSGRLYLDRIRAATTRMASLIDDLLQLSRVGRREMMKGRVNLSDMAGLLVEELRNGEPDRKVVTTIDEDLVAIGDRRLLGVVMQNLLGNAWKFTGKNDHARIEVGRGVSKGGREQFFVRDNGAGFDMTYHDKLFAPFQRLHNSTDFPGAGVGLATVQRIIHRHRGRVWADSEVGAGSTFSFSLPSSGSGTDGQVPHEESEDGN